jgi:hypothetical protein
MSSDKAISPGRTFHINAVKYERIYECLYVSQNHLHQMDIKDGPSWSTFYRLGLPLKGGTKDSSHWKGRPTILSALLHLLVFSHCFQIACLIQLTPTLLHRLWTESCFAIWRVRNSENSERNMFPGMDEWNSRESCSWVMDSHIRTDSYRSCNLNLCPAHGFFLQTPTLTLSLDLSTWVMVLVWNVGEEGTWEHLWLCLTHSGCVWFDWMWIVQNVSWGQSLHTLRYSVLVIYCNHSP